ncbi:MAG: hypothetical protein HC923_04830 [Myxococcales bacterium]|nr:hypothetical protein [Myxococcales bacterium]
MKRKSGGFILCLVVGAAPGSARSSPPVEVEVVIDGEEDDFFSSDGDGTSNEKGTSTTKTASSVNTQTQVVNITIRGSEVETNRPAAKEAAPSSGQAAATPAPQATPEPAPSSDAVVSETIERDRGWWYIGNPKGGQVLLTLHGGAFKGLGIEGYLNDVVALHLDLGFDGVFPDRDEDRAPTDLVEHGNFALPDIQLGQLNDGFLYMVDAGPRFHLTPRSEWDLYVGLGASWFGYRLDAVDQPTVFGGSAFGRVSSGLRWHWHRLSLGFDFAWYPVEIGRFQSERDANGDDDLRSIEISSSERYRADRYAGSFRIGLRF